MSLTEVAVNRPQRWDVPFGNAMTDEDVERLLEIEPFRHIDPAWFPNALPLRGILRNDTRINRYQKDDIIVRAGDYGNSAFLVLRGKVQIVLDGLDPETLGREPKKPRGVVDALIRWWRQPRLPEVRSHLAAEDRQTAERDEAESLSDTQIFLQDVPRLLENARTVSLHPGEIFGELAALTRTQRTATVLAEEETYLLEIRWQGLRDLMRRTDALRQHVERLYRENSLRVHLRETPLLSRLPAEHLNVVAEATVFETHGDFEWQAKFNSAKGSPQGEPLANEPLIAEEQTPADGIVLVRSGFARLSHRHGHGHRTVAYLGKGQVFGIAEAIDTYRTGQPQSLRTSLRALGYVDVLRISQALLQEHVFPYLPEAHLEQIAKKHALYCTRHHCNPDAESTGGEQPQVETPLLEFLVENRLINGREAMVLDLDRCTRCDDCVRACAATHDNNPRFIRHGLRHNSYMIANACMHCVDPVCMIGCPTGAIGRDTATGIVRINDLTCIGCATCANSCPYQNIRMVEVRDTQGAIAVDEATQQPIHKATKCDLCADQPSGPACQRACPHDALVRLDLGNLGELSEWVGR